MAIAAYVVISAISAAWLAHSTSYASEAVKAPKRWILLDGFLGFFWPIALYVWLMNTDMKWASASTRDGWSEK
ncbi:hypothetical protein [Gluconobacter oxydans]|uniref:hypothetical protein n=1 Tax=Gluconobacter oxydans TaxID=442 RepID=UPI0003149119|nr:hypothetical protein [Gluconobacter oxydans]